MPQDRVHDSLRRDIPAEIDDGIPIIFEKEPDDIFTDVVNIAFHGGNHECGLTVALFSLCTADLITAKALFAASALIKSCGR